MRAFLWILFWTTGCPVALLRAQQAPLDSLVELEQNYLKEDTIRIKLLNDLARGFYNVDPSRGVFYADKSIILAEKLKQDRLLAGDYSAKGTNKMNQADYPGAMEYYHKAFVYNDLGDFQRAIEYYEKAQRYCENSGNKQVLSGVLVNIGNVYTQLKDYPRALRYKQEALEISRQLGNKARIANNLSNIGNVYTQLANYPQALEYHQKALEINKGLQDLKGIAVNMSGIGTVFMLQKDYGQALSYTTQARELAAQLELLSTQSEALQNLSTIYEAAGRFDSAYACYRGYIDIRNRIDNVEVQKQITKKTLQFEFSKTEDSLRQQQIITDAKLQAQILLAAQQQQELKLKQNAVDLSNKERALQKLEFLKTQADLLFAQSQNKIKEEALIRTEKEKQLQAAKVNLQQTQRSLKDQELQAQKNQRLYYIAGMGLLVLLLRL